MAKVTINLPNRPVDDLVEIVGLGVFKNGYVYDLAEVKDDIVYGAEYESLVQAPPVKSEAEARSGGINELLELSDADLDSLAEEFKVTFDEGMTREEKAEALVDSYIKEGGN